MRRKRLLQAIWSVGIAFAVSPPAHAHHSPSEVVEALTKRIEAGENTVAIFIRRGDEYRAIAKPESAVADYRSALKLSPAYLPALHGLAHASFQQHRFAKTLEVSQQGIAASDSADQAATFHALSARTYEQQLQWERALSAWKKSLASSRPNINWFLGESRALTKLDRLDAARLSLEAAMQRNPSIVLRRAWIQSLIDCGEAKEASLHIEAGLARSRWKSSWLLLRARLELSQNHTREAQRDAASALQEIDSRWKPNTANPWLSSDRQQALAILSD